MNKIYADTAVCSWHLRQLAGELEANSAVFHMPFPFTFPIRLEFESKIQQALNDYDKVIILVSELHESTVKFCLDYQQSKITYFTCGSIQGVKHQQWMDWFITTTTFYKNNPTVLDELNPYETKPRYFDILLGQPRPSRQTIYNYINSNDLNTKVIMTYLNGNTLQSQQQNGWQWEPGVDPEGQIIKDTVTPIKYRGSAMSLSQVVPISIYNQTAYSIVAETNNFDHFNFYTEKIVKPILAERLFLVSAGRNYLKNLRSLGFRTFDGIIDESYDSIPSQHPLHFKLFSDQIQYLLSQPQEDILNKIQSITKHNKQVMLNTNWYGNFSKELRESLLAHEGQN
jgi:hypothetical protein